MGTDGTAVGGAQSLSTAEIEQIRAGLEAGRRPKVVFTAEAGQIAGQQGRVVQLTDPAESEEWVVVQFGRDELPFAPTDLALPVRGSRGRTRPTPPAPGAPSPQPPKPREAQMETTETGTADAGNAADGGAPKDGAPSGGKRATGRGDGDGEDSAGAGGSGQSGGGKAAKRTAKATKAAKPKAPPAMTVQLAYENGEWTVAAYQGSKTVAKPYVVRPAEALKLVSMVDVPGVHEAVSQIVAAERTEAERRAESLRHELAEVEARLSELQNPELPKPE